MSDKPPIPLDYITPEPRRRRWWNVTIWDVLLIAVIAFVLTLLMLPSVNKS